MIFRSFFIFHFVPKLFTCLHLSNDCMLKLMMMIIHTCRRSPEVEGLLDQRRGMEEKLLMLNSNEVYKQLLRKHKKKKLRYVLGVLNIELVTQVLFIVIWEVNIYQVFIQKFVTIFIGSFEIYSVQYFILKIILWDIYYFYSFIEVLQIINNTYVKYQFDEFGHMYSWNISTMKIINNSITLKSFFISCVHSFIQLFIRSVVTMDVSIFQNFIWMES